MGASTLLQLAPGHEVLLLIQLPRIYIYLAHVVAPDNTHKVSSPRVGNMGHVTWGLYGPCHLSTWCLPP